MLRSFLVHLRTSVQQLSIIAPKSHKTCHIDTITAIPVSRDSRKSAPSCWNHRDYRNGMIYAFYSGSMMQKVPLVEDNRDCRDLFSIIIRRLGYRVVEAESGTAAVEKTYNELPDLVLMDVSLPGMNGIKATARIKSNPVTCCIPVVMCSALHSEQIVHEALSAGAAEFVSKPVSVDSLREVLQTYLPLPGDARDVNPQTLERSG